MPSIQRICIVHFFSFISHYISSSDIHCTQTPDGSGDHHPTAGREALSRLVSCLHASHSSPTNSGYNDGTASGAILPFVGILRLHTSVCLVFFYILIIFFLGLSIPCRRNILTQLKCRNYWRQTMNLIKSLAS